MAKFVVVDIDGTIAKVGERLKYITQTPKDYEAFYNACDEDEVITPIADLVTTLINHYNIVFCTGRKEYCYEKTYKWLENYILGKFMTGSPLLMRNKNDNRHDIDVKPELLFRWMRENHYTQENIAFILEDRTSMVNKWRKLGFTCLQVANGDY
jgi:hypothetical protein